MWHPVRTPTPRLTAPLCLHSPLTRCSNQLSTVMWHPVHTPPRPPHLPLSPHQTVTWHSTHPALQHAHPQSLTHLPRQSYTAHVTCPDSARVQIICGAASSADRIILTHPAIGQLFIQAHGAVTTPAHIHLTNTLHTCIQNLFNIPIHGTLSNFGHHAI